MTSARQQLHRQCVYQQRGNPRHRSGPELDTAVRLHAVDALGLVHAMILRLQAVVLPVKTLVLSGH